MTIITLLLSGLLSIFSTTIMCYVSIATPIGPWIAPTLILAGMIFFKVLSSFFHIKDARHNDLILATASGSIGGILATGFGFSFPTLFFLDSALFQSWLNQPVFFITVCAALSLAAGGLGLLIADLFAHRLINEQQLAFPIGELSYKMIKAQDQLSRAYELIIGFFSTTLFCIAQDGITLCKKWVPALSCYTRCVIPESITLLPSFSWGMLAIPTISFSMMPLLWAIGFVTGHVMFVPLGVGLLSKLFVVDLINRQWFAAMSNSEFTLAFGSGMVLAGTITGMLNTPAVLYKAFKQLRFSTHLESKKSLFKTIMSLETIILIGLIITFLTYFNFSLIAQLYLIIFTFICTYQMAVIAGKIGLAQLGRFATFVMVPAIFLFNINYIQIMLLATFVEICGGVAVDALFGRKMAYLGNVSTGKIKNYQLFGLIISSLTIGVVAWLLINRFGLGSQELYAQKAYLRALLIQSTSFNYYVLGIGFVFGYALKLLNLNPMLVLSGILMQIPYTIGLMFGGALTYLTKDAERFYPFWSGIFAANSIWMLIKAIF